MQQTKDIILKAIALIENPDAWTQGVSARDSTGCAVSITAAEACRWCTIGAIDKVSYDNVRYMAATRTVREAMMREQKFFLSIAKFNDTHTHAEVLALLRKAAA